MHLLLPGVVYHAIPKTNDYPSIKEHVLDTFDWYPPKFQSKHTYPEVFSRFEEAGLEGIRIMQIPVAESGHRPAKETPTNILDSGKEKCNAFASDGAMK